MRTVAAVIFMFCLLAPGARAETPDPLLLWMDHIAQGQLDQRSREIDGIRAIPAAKLRQQAVRAKLLDILGGLPNYAGPLQARLTGQLHADSYTIEKILFQSLPGFYVTANVYRPNSPRRYPAVLLQAGHTQEGKPEPQIAAANFAMKGFVAMTFDPIGQGEREQTYLRELGRPLSGGAGNEHIQAGAQSLLIGESVARYFIFDAKRSIDYLASRPDVDPNRIGCAGCSGGGALTTFIGALDPRVKAVAPACFINSYRLLFSGPDPDSEMSLPDFLHQGLDVADFVETRAPTPWLLLATEQDYFTPPGARMVYDEARRWFALLGAEDHVRFFVGPGPHGTPRETRQEMYRWMIRFLNGGRGDDRDRPIHEYTNRELQVSRTGHVDDEPGSRKLYQIIQDGYRARKHPGSAAELLARLRELGIPSDGRPPQAQSSGLSRALDFSIEQVRFLSEPGVEVGGKLYLPDTQGRKPAIVLLGDQAGPVPLHVSKSPATATLAESLARAGRIVFEFEPRDSPSSHDGRPFLGNWLANERAGQIGLNLPAMRAHDILRAVDLLAARDDVDSRSIRGAARGVKGIWLLLASAADPRLEKIWLDRTPHSLASALEMPLGLNLFDAVIPAFALHWDLRDLTAAMGRRSVLWSDPTNWMDETVWLGAPYVYRTVRQADDDLIKAFLN